MFPSHMTPFLLLALHLSSTSAQFISSLPDCVQTCISDSQDESCSTLDIPCFCRAAATGTFLTDVMACIHAQCDNDIDDNVLLMPLQFACGLAGTPIPEAVLSSAEARASSLEMETASTTATTADEYPTSFPAAASTSTIPVILPGSTRKSSTLTVTSTQSVAASTSSPSRSGTHTSTSTHTVTSSVESSSSVSGAGSSTDSASKTSTGSETSSKTSAAPDGGNTDSAPFTNTNDAPNVVGNVGTWFALTIAMAAGFALVLS